MQAKQLTYLTIVASVYGVAELISTLKLGSKVDFFSAIFTSCKTLSETLMVFKLGPCSSAVLCLLHFYGVCNWWACRLCIGIALGKCR